MPLKDLTKRAEYQQEYHKKNKEHLNRKNRQYYKDNQGRLVEYAREYRKTNKYKERITEYKRQYAIDNKDKINERAHKWYLANKEKARTYRKAWAEANPGRRNAYNKKARLKARREAFEAYGGTECKCCGESNELFLTIDHMNNNGNKHRKSINSRGGHGFYAWLRQNKYPEGYQVLCFNCNMSKGFCGTCPHTIAPL